jgi:hypothetical protein
MQARGGSVEPLSVQASGTPSNPGRLHCPCRCGFFACEEHLLWFMTSMSGILAGPLIWIVGSPDSLQ